jgi:ribonuclease BN (tRNA processing enzyme)
VLLTVLGCSGSFPGPNAPASGYLVEADDFLLAMDLGNGTFAELLARHDPLRLDAVLLSHLHPDHCADFSAMTVVRRYHPEPVRDPREDRLPVYAPREAPTRLAAAYAPDEKERLSTDLSDVYEFHPLGPQTLHIGPFEVTPVPVVHPCEAFGFRVSYGGRTLAYTGDSGICDSLVDLASGVDVLLSEASWTHAEDRPPDLHLSGKEAGQVAERAGAGRLLVTHVPPWSDPDAILAEAVAEFRGDTGLVTQGASYRI